LPQPPKWGPDGREIEEGEWERDQWPLNPYSSEAWISNQAGNGDVDIEELKAEAQRLEARGGVQEKVNEYLGYKGGEAGRIFRMSE